MSSASALGASRNIKMEIDMNDISNNLKKEMGDPASHFRTPKVEYEETETAYVMEDTEMKVYAKRVKGKARTKDGVDIIRTGNAIIPKRSQGTGISVSVSFEHKCRLRQLLKKMFRAHRWNEAAGVLSTLLKGTCQCRLSLKNRRKYWAAMELLRRIDPPSGSSWKVQRIYENWLNKQPSANSTLRKKRYLIQLEAALLSVMEGKVEDGFNITKFLVQEPECRNNPVIHMVHGLVLYHLWYANIPEDLRLSHIGRQDAVPSVSDPSFGPCDNSDPVKAPSSSNAVGHIKEKPFSGYNSDSSIGNLKDVQNVIKNKPPSRIQLGDLRELKFYMDGASDMNENEDIHYTDECDAADLSYAYLGTNLLPIQIQNLLHDDVDPVYSCTMMVNELHKDAVKHLRIAVSSKPPVIGALLPLVQLLLLGGLVEDALEELKNFSLNSEHSIPSRIRAHLFGGLRIKNFVLLSACHEDFLKKDPTSRDSLIHLIKMHKSGNYATEKLVEMIALHLDATCGTYNVWEEFATLFLNIQTAHFQFEEDRFSTERMSASSARSSPFMSSTLPRIFSGKEQKNVWKLRCRWWFTRHFSHKIYLEEKLYGDLRLLTFKAACAAHLYGKSFDYVSSVESHLQEHDQKDFSLILRKHMEVCLNLQSKFNKTA